MLLNRLSYGLVLAAALAGCGGGAVDSGFDQAPSELQKTLTKPEVDSITSDAKDISTTAGSDNGAIVRPLVRIAGPTLARDGIYQLFSANGMRYALQLSFTNGAYSLTNAWGILIAAGTFNRDPSDPQGYIFSTNPELGLDKARFRTSEDAIVGMYPLPAPFDASARELRPFIAVRRIAMTLLEAAGTFNRIGVTRTAAGAIVSSLEVVSISGGGTMEVCRARYTISQCPEGLRKTYVLQSAQPVPGQWVAVDQSNINIRERFYIASVNGEPVFLSAETDLLTGTSLFQVGLSETMFWRPAKLRGGTSNSEYSTGSINESLFKTTLLAGGGSETRELMLTSLLNHTGPIGIRDATGPTSTGNFFLIKSSRLLILSSKTSAAAGYLQFGLVDLPHPIVSPLPLKLIVKANGTVIAPDGSGKYPIRSGALIELESTRNIGMFSAEGDNQGWFIGPVSALNIGVSERTARSLTMELSNLSTNSINIMISATSVGVGMMSLTLIMSPGDARNGDYRRYSLSNGGETLRLDFDLQRYLVTDGLASIAGRFSEDPTEAGTYFFHSSRNQTVVNTARFRTSAGVVVGAFPSRVATISSVSYPVRPFVAARNFVTMNSAPQLDGVYNVFGSLDNNGLMSSRAYQIRISQSGTTLEACNDPAVQSIDVCISKRTYKVRSYANSDSFVYYDAATPGGPEIPFRMASVDGRFVFLSATHDPVPSSRYLEVGLPDSSVWTQTFGRGGSTSGDYGLSQISAATYSASLVRADGATQRFSYALSAISGLSGIRSVNMAATGRYLAAQSGSLAMLVGEPNNSETQGYLRLELLDQH